MAMRVAHICFSDRSGGAARAAFRLHQGMNQHPDLDSHMIVLRQTSDDPKVHRLHLNRVQRLIRKQTLRRQEKPNLRRYPKYDGTQWSNGRASTPVLAALAELQPDVAHVHWVGDGMLSIRDIAAITPRLGLPVVWTLHDMWLFTGGCHYAGSCTRFRESCGKCPILGSESGDDLSTRNLGHKRDVWKDTRFTIVTPSRWLANQVRESALFKDHAVNVIANGIDTQVYQPYDQRTAREVFGLPMDAKLILFGAYQLDDTRKGVAYLRDALAHLHTYKDLGAVELVTFGSGPLPLDLPYPVHRVGRLDDDRLLALLYTAADVLVVPSLQDNLPNTVVEALACGTPCAAFNIGGMPDMIAHKSNGYLAEPFVADDLARGIAWAFGARDEAHLHARESALTNFDLSRVVKAYAELYELVNSEA